jgi:hypothetical protein
VLPPPLDGGGIGFHGLSTRFLGSDSSLRQPGREIIRIKVDVPLAFDDLGDSSSRPEFSREAERFGILAKPTEDDAFASSIQFGFRPLMRNGLEARVATLAMSLLPSSYRPNVNAEKLGDLLGGVSVLETLNCEYSPPLQFGSRAWWSHDQYYAQLPPADKLSAWVFINLKVDNLQCSLRSRLNELSACE